MKTLEELKAGAYDCLVQLEAWQRNLKEANDAIANFKPLDLLKDLPKENKKV